MKVEVFFFFSFPVSFLLLSTPYSPSRHLSHIALQTDERWALLPHQASRICPSFDADDADDA